MAVGQALPASAMTRSSVDHRDEMMAHARGSISAISSGQSLSFAWTYIPAAASRVSLAFDGSLWALSTGPSSAPDKSIWHYTGNGWVNLPGAAIKIAPAVDGSLYAITSLGYLYHYVNGAWSGLGGGSKDLAVDLSGNVFVIASGTNSDAQVWENSGGIWAPVNGAGSHVAAAPGSLLYVTTASGSIYSSNAGGFGQYVQCPGSVEYVAPLAGGEGFYGLASTSAPASGSLLYQFSNSYASSGTCQSGAYRPTNGFGVDVTTDGINVAVVGTDAAIYTTADLPYPQTSPTPYAVNAYPTPPGYQQPAARANRGPFFNFGNSDIYVSTVGATENGTTASITLFGASTATPPPSATFQAALFDVLPPIPAFVYPGSTIVAYLEVISSINETFNKPDVRFYPGSGTFQAPAGTLPYLALLDPTNLSAGWQPAFSSGHLISGTGVDFTAFSSVASTLSMTANEPYYLALYYH